MLIEAHPVRGVLRIWRRKVCGRAHRWLGASCTSPFGPLAAPMFAPASPDQVRGRLCLRERQIRLERQGQPQAGPERAAWRDSAQGWA